MTKIVNLILRQPDKPALYIINGRDGNLLIDTAYRVSRSVVNKFASKHNVKWIFLTHAHFDHVNNAAFLRQQHGCKIIIHENDAEIVRSGRHRRLYPTSEKYRFRVGAINASADVIRISKFEPDYILKDTDTDFLKKLGFDAEIVMLPGHTLGSMGILDGDVLYAGDAVSSVKGQYKPVFLAEDVEKTRESAMKIFGCGPKYICAGHGSPIKLRD